MYIEESMDKYAARKSAQAVVDAAVIVNKNNFGVQISNQTKKRWVKLITYYPELTSNLFTYGKTTRIA